MITFDKRIEQILVTHSIADGYLTFICDLYVSAQEISNPVCREEVELMALDRLDRFLNRAIKAFDLPNHLDD